MTHLQILTKYKDDLQKLRDSYQKKYEKKLNQTQEKHIKFKGVECFNEKDVFGVYEAGECTSSEYDKAIIRLNTVLKTDKKEELKDYIDFLDNIIINLLVEIKEEKKKYERS